MGEGLTLILGGARSGKSAHGKRLAAEKGSRVLFVATAEAGDEEMARRIAAHRASRPRAWETLEAPRGTGTAIRLAQAGFEVVLLDCITLLASNVLSALPEPLQEEAAESALAAEVEDILEAYRKSEARWIITSNEVGLGIVPVSPIGRIYRDALGRANQLLASLADVVIFMVAGIPMRVK